MADITAARGEHQGYTIALLNELGFSNDELILIWTDEAIHAYDEQARAWWQAGYPKPVTDMFPDLNDVTPGDTVLDITPSTHFWMSGAGEAVGGIMDAVDLPEIGRQLNKYLMIAAVIVVGIAVIAVAR